MEPTSTFPVTTPWQRGFTLVEMMVVLGIIATVTTIALFGQSTFNRSLLLTDTTYTVALSIREMQTYGLSSRKFGSVQNAGYGFHVETARPNGYVLFADTGGTGLLANCPTGSLAPELKPGNCRYDTGTDGVVETFSFTHGFTVSDFCGTDSGGTRRCASTGYLTGLDVLFLRSNTESIMTGIRSGGNITLSDAEIYIDSQDGSTTRAVCVSRVGQVSVAQDICP